MAHIHTEPGQHDHTVSAFIMRERDGSPHVFLHIHKKLGRWLQFGGHVELDETPWQALTHELKEESGYDLDQLKLLQPRIRIKHLSDAILHPIPVSLNTHAFDATHFHTDMAFAFTTDQDPRHRLDASEAQDLRWFSRQEVVDIPSGDIPEGVRESILFVFDVCLQEMEPVDAAQFA
jgi:8-oxo-dGTP pyrophosphatase MutT (NUDIX family)